MENSEESLAESWESCRLSSDILPREESVSWKAGQNVWHRNGLISPLVISLRALFSVLTEQLKVTKQNKTKHYLVISLDQMLLVAQTASICLIKAHYLLRHDNIPFCQYILAQSASSSCFVVAPILSSLDQTQVPKFSAKRIPQIPQAIEMLWIKRFTFDGSSLTYGELQGLLATCLCHRLLEKVALHWQNLTTSKTNVSPEN